jgi:hypothetical protein
VSNHHYVPQWYQEGFFETGRKTLAYVDRHPRQETLSDGRIITHRSKFDTPTSRAFCESDLYSTFFGNWVNEEIERRLFGDIDTRGSKAIRAFSERDVSEWHRHFQTLFEYIDIQKIRTPKGLDWVKAQYPSLTQNNLMMEMQGIRMMHCTIWTEGVREIVSAEDSGVKFIVSDHPVTIYNHALAPDAPSCAYPYDPAIALKASQTIFPLNRDFCLILTNLEYAKDPSANPLEKRTFARNYRASMVRTDKFIRTRRLTSREVTRINHILKARGRRYLAAGREEWLYPEAAVTEPWSELRETLLPPDDELWHFGGEIYARFEGGHVHYQDAFGRTEKQREFLVKAPPARKLRSGDPCGCGSGKRFSACCMTKREELRPTWLERSIRERNLFLGHAIVDILGLDKGKDWTAVRRDLTDDQIKQVYVLYEALWPLETDLLHLLPKPDGQARAIYTGSIHPQAISEFALGASLYFGELVVQTPFVHNGVLAEDYKPVEQPRAYRHEFLKTVLFFLTVMPLVEAGLINLIPDPCDFDYHLRRQMMSMAENRSPWLKSLMDKETRAQALMQEDMKRSLMCLPRDAMRTQLQRAVPELVGSELEEALTGIEQLREQDPLAVLQEDTLVADKGGGQLNLMKLAPNFEMAMYLAQATGASIVTDSPVRWNEIQRAARWQELGPAFGLTALARNIENSTFRFPSNVEGILDLASTKRLGEYPSLVREAFKYLATLRARAPRPNVEAGLAARFSRVHGPAQNFLAKTDSTARLGRISCAFPIAGIQENTINRLLLMSSSEHHLASVPMAFFVEGASPSRE